MRIGRRRFLGLLAAAPLLKSQEADRRPVFRVKVDMVVLSFTVMDSQDHYVDGLKPSDIQVFEDGIPQKIATFSEGAGAPVAVGGDSAGLLGEEAGELPALSRLESLDALTGASIFILFDTSNIMYRGFTYAQDAIADFVRGLSPSDSVAVYTFSRNLSRAAALTRDHNHAIAGLRDAVAGDDTALYNALLLTVRDAVSGPAFDRLAQGTGGRTYWARTWRQQAQAFREIGAELGNSYTVTYYPAPNPNQGFRRILVAIAGDAGKRFRVHARPGYRPAKS